MPMNASVAANFSASRFFEAQSPINDIPLTITSTYESKREVDTIIAIGLSLETMENGQDQLFPMFGKPAMANIVADSILVVDFLQHPNSHYPSVGIKASCSKPRLIKKKTLYDHETAHIYLTKCKYDVETST